MFIAIWRIHPRNARSSHYCLIFPNDHRVSRFLENFCKVWVYRFTCILFELERAQSLVLFWLCRFLSPLSIVPFVTLVGLGLYERGFPQVSIFTYILENDIPLFSCSDCGNSPPLLASFDHLESPPCDMYDVNWTFSKKCNFSLSHIDEIGVTEDKQMGP